MELVYYDTNFVYCAINMGGGMRCAHAHQLLIVEIVIARLSITYKLSHLYSQQAYSQ